MSKTKISELPAATTLANNAVAPWSSPTVTNKVSYQTLRNLILSAAFPVGAVIYSTSLDTVAKVQAQYGGTWVRYAEGRAIFGYQAGSTNFATVNGTGGSLTHTHSTGDHTLTSSEMPNHYHGLAQKYGAIKGSTGAWALKGANGSNAYCTIEYNVTYPPGNGTQLIGNTENTGGGGKHNHGNTGSTSTLPNYVTVYAYRRTV